MNETCRQILYELSSSGKIKYFGHEYPKPFKLEKRLRDVLEDDVDEKYYLSDKILETFSKHTEKHTEKGNGFKFEPKGDEDISDCLTARYAKMVATDTFIKEQKGIVGILNIKGNDHIKRVYGVDGEAPCLQTMQGGNREPKILDDQGRTKKRDNPELLDHCPTLRAQSHGNEPKVVESTPLRFLDRNQKNINGDYSFTVDTTNTGGIKEITGDVHRIRKLTPKECWRLQGFPDKAHDKAKEAGVSDSQRYKQAGNSITVDVMMHLIKSIFEPKKDSLF